MPYYSELGLYTSPASSFPGVYVPGPYSNHSSIIASNFTRSPPTLIKTIPRSFRTYKPHLATITENQSPLRRINSPKIILHGHTVARPIKINTADIDVSVNKYRKYDRPNRQQKDDNKIIERKTTERKSPSPQNKESSPSTIEEKEAKPNKIIRRDRPTIRIQTIHKDLMPSEILVTKSWRDNFDPAELNIEEEKRIKKSPGELLKEKFLIKDAALQIPEPTKRLSRKGSKKNSGIQKTPSFHDICTAITADSIDEELNPGQPPEIQRRQSRQISTEEIIKEFKRNSGDLTNEITLLDEIMNNQCNTELLEDIQTPQEDYNSSNSVRKKKKLTKKKSNEKLIIDSCDNNKSSIPRRLTQKKIKRTSTDESIASDVVDPETEKDYQAAIRDISQVVVEKVKNKPKPIITGTVDIDEMIKPSLKAVIDEVEVEESPKPQKKNRFKFNVIVEEIEEPKKIIRKTSKKSEQKSKGKIHISKPKELVVTNVLKHKQNCSVGEILEEKIPKIRANLKSEEIAKKIVDAKKVIADKTAKLEELKKAVQAKSNEEKPVTNNTDINSNINNTILDLKSSQSDPTLNKNVKIEEASQSQKIEEKSITNKEVVLLNKPQTIQRSHSSKAELNNTNLEILENVEVKGKILDDQKQQSSNDQTTTKGSIKNSLSKSNISDKHMDKISEEADDKSNTENFWEAIGPRDSVYITPKKTVLPKIADNTEPLPKLMPSKRSLVMKANKDDPDLEIFVPPEPEPEPEPEPVAENNVFVPLQSNRLSQFMHPFKKPEQYDECPIEIFARPKTIRKRHYPRPRHPPLTPESAPPPEPKPESSDEDEEEDDESGDDDTTSEDTSSDEYDVNIVYGNKIGASTSSNDSGFDSGVPGSRNKECDVNCHKKCVKLTANLCGVNQKLIVEAIESVKKGSSENRDSPISNLANNPAFLLDSEIPEEFSTSSTFAGFQKSGRITPPATTIPRFRKYCADDFNFLKVLGKGSFGKVLLAELKNTDYYYAIKCMRKDVVLEDDDVECTLIERKVLALGTKHPYLCHLLCTFQTESHLFFVMEYLNGGDLMFHIQTSGRFNEYRAKFYGAEIVSGLKFLHNKGIVYRDLKLDNILLDFDGHVRIADFGMCKLQIFLDRMADTFCGTPDYMAPEIIKGQHYNQCVDWWSFGVLLYEMLIGQSPFSGCDEDELFWSICNEKPVIPRFLTAEASAILLLFLEKDGNKRLGNRFCPQGDIQDQPFFKQIQWDKLEARQLEAPFKPNLRHPLDTQYFDRTFTVEKVKLTPTEPNILASMDQTQFQGFSYTNPNATDK